MLDEKERVKEDSAKEHKRPGRIEPNAHESHLKLHTRWIYVIRHARCL